MKKSKRFKAIGEMLKEKGPQMSAEEAVEALQNCPKLKFDQTVEISLKLGVDPKKADQQVRSTVSLPHGTGKKNVVVVIAKADKVKEALEAGADIAGEKDIIEKINGGWTAFDVLIVTPDMMREVGKLGKVLGPRGLMPSPKAGTVTSDIAKAIKEIKAGKIEFKVDKTSVINSIVGKISFEKGKIVENIKTLIQAVQRAKPSSSKGIYIQTVFLSSTMGPGIKLDLQSISAI